MSPGLPPVDYVAPRALAAAACMDCQDARTARILEEVLLFALRRDPDATRDLLTELMLSEDRGVRVWAIGPFLAALRAWDALD